jgi:putative nucleotidyltransferase with HDIG domain
MEAAAEVPERRRVGTGVAAEPAVAVAAARASPGSRVEGRAAAPGPAPVRRAASPATAATRCSMPSSRRRARPSRPARRPQGGLPQLEALVWGLAEALARGARPAYPLAPLREPDELVYVHSVNVALLALAHAKALGFRGEVLKEIGLGALLHDVGKLSLPPELVVKDGPLDRGEWQLMRRHPELGAARICELDATTTVAALVAYEHHLRYDGEPSYPLLKTRASRSSRASSPPSPTPSTACSPCGRAAAPPRARRRCSCCARAPAPGSTRCWCRASAASTRLRATRGRRPAAAT